MKGLLLFITIITFGCSTATKPTDKNFDDLTQEEKIKSLGHLGEELKGDFLLYSGQQVILENSTGLQALDSMTFIELVMDKDNRFAIRLKFVESEIKADTMTFHIEGGYSNKGTGKWSDLGNKFELKFQDSTVDSFFDDENNKGQLEVIDNYTLRFNKSVDKIWIWKTLCKKEGN